MSATACLALGAILALAGCREGPAPFEPPEREALENGSAWQLTYSVYDDRTPAWLGGGDSVVYANIGLEFWPAAPHVLMGLPAAGGVASPLLPSVQPLHGVRRRLLAPAVSPDGERVAYAELWNIQPPRPFRYAAKQCSDGDADPTFPMLVEVILRVRRPADAGSLEHDPALHVPFDGRELVVGGVEDIANLYVTRQHPFHTLFDQEGAAVFRPSWSPDGRRLAFSDGLRIFVWEVGSAAAVPIPGTEEGVLAAWSPAGDWIAFTRLGRGPEHVSRCDFVYRGALLVVQERHEYALTGRTLALVRPDGSELRELDEGEAPAWTADGSAVYASRGGRLWRVPIDGSAAAPVPNTEGAVEPAVSPDGSRLAFSRRVAGGDYNVWVLSLGG